jgi:hypothetical protein
MTGRVLVVAGEHPALALVADVARASGALVAVVSRTLGDVAATVRFRADPSDEGTWDRVLMHIEQHLGPVDGAATDVDCNEVVRGLLVPDLDRRGHGDVVVVTGSSDARELLTRMVGTRQAAPSRPTCADAGP